MLCIVYIYQSVSNAHRIFIEHLFSLHIQNAMYTMGISDDDQLSIMQIVAGILHMGNIAFTEVGNYAQPENPDCK